MKFASIGHTIRILQTKKKVGQVYNSIELQI